MLNMKWFDYAHLPDPLQRTSHRFYSLAHVLDTTLKYSEEKAAGMRKLLEAKDCFVRAQLEEDGG